MDNHHNNSVLNSEIIKESFHHTAKSFSLFINKNVTIDLININNSYINKSKENNSLVVLFSEIKGNLTGKCYLKFTNSDARKFYSACLPNEYLNDEDMKTGILTELDNVLTASVITVLANRLKVHTYAHVPFLLKMNNSEFEDMLKIDINSNSRKLINFHSVFKIEELSLKTEFIWIINSEILEN